MKNIAIVVALIAVLGIGGYILKNNKTEVPASSQTDMTPIVGTANRTPATVSVLDKGVFVIDTKTANNNQVEVTSSTTVELATTVKTNSDGRALVAMESGKIIVDKDSELALADLPKGQTSGTLNAGSVWSQVEKIFDKGEFYEIKTQNTVASVRGTSFGVSIKNGETTVYVTKGIVKVTPKKDGVLEDDKSLMITAGNKATVDINGNISSQLLGTDDMRTEWYTLNNPIDPKKNPPLTPQPITPITKVVVPTPITRTPTSPSTSPSGTSPSNTTGNGSSGGTVTAAKFGINGISPKTVSASSQTDVITINGNVFSNVSAVYAGTYLLDFGIISDTTVTTGLPNQIRPGVYDITLVNSDGVKVTASNAITVTQ